MVCETRDLTVDIERTRATRFLMYRRAGLAHLIDEHTSWLFFTSLGLMMFLIVSGELRDSGVTRNVIAYSFFAAGLLALGIGSRRAISRSRRMIQIPVAVDAERLRQTALHLVRDRGWRVEADTNDLLIARTHHRMELTIIYEFDGYLLNARPVATRYGRASFRTPAQHKELRTLKSALVLGASE